MRPYYFGDSARPLYGAYEAAAGKGTPRGAVLLCYPFGAEYLRSHRALRELAKALSDAGLHTFRFDYYGCGDSSGASTEGTIELWLEDIRLAFEELCASSDTTRPSILGLRLGGTLAAIAASRGLPANHLLLWDPIVNGAGYVEELDGRHRALIATRPKPADYVADDPPTEALGTPLPAALLNGLGALDLGTIEQCAARRVLIIGRPDDEQIRPFRDRLSSLRVDFDLAPIDATPVWLKQDDMERTLVPRNVLDLVVEQLTEARP